jgi:hypothetical protein
MGGTTGDGQERMRFRRMDEGTDDDFALLARGACNGSRCAARPQVSFDPDYRPLETFEPMVRRLLTKEWRSPA